MVLLTLLCCGCAPEPAPPPEGIPLVFEAVDLGTRLGPRFLPAAATVPLSEVERADLPGASHLEGFLRLGPRLAAEEPGYHLIVGRIDDGRPWEILFVEPLAAGGGESRRIAPTAGHLGDDAIFRLDLELPHLDGTWRSVERYVVEIPVPGRDGGPPPQSLSAYGFSQRLARVQVDGLDLTVLLADGDSDGLFGPGDPWVVLEDAALLAGPFTRETAREVGEFAWAAGRAWMLGLQGSAGRRGLLSPHDPGMTEEEDERRRGSRPADRKAPRAATPLACAERGAASGGAGDPAVPARGRLLLFDAARGAECRALDRLVLTAAPVAEAAEGIGCTRIDAERDSGSLERYRLSGVPSGVVLDGEGSEVARFEGYIGVMEMAALLRKLPR